MMSIVNVDQDTSTIKISKFDIDNQIVYNYFNKLPAADRDEAFTKAMYIGVLAMMEDRISAFLAKTNNELGTELESLKMLFDFKKEMFYKTSMKGLAAEDDVADYLNKFVTSSKLKDKVSLTGTSVGKMKRNKTGDIICSVNGKDDIKIVVECKFDKSVQYGHIKDKDIFNKTARKDTVWSQLLEASANREGKISIMVMDKSLVNATVSDMVQNVKYIPQIGLVALIDTQRGDYDNLGIAYCLARDIALNSKEITLDKDILSVIMNRLIKDMADVLSVKELVNMNIENNKKILGQLEKNTLSIAYTKRYLSKFLKDGTLTKEDMFDFYSGQEIKDQFKIIEKEINDL